MQHRTPAEGDAQDDTSLRDDNMEWDTSSKSDSVVQGSHNKQSQSMMDMPSMMDDVTSGLAMPSDGNTLPTSGTGMSGTDDFSAMFGVSDIFDFDFDGGQATNSSSTGLFGASTGGMGGASDTNESAKVSSDVKAESKTDS